MQFEIIRAGSSQESPESRVSWPWKNMNVGDMVIIEDQLRGRAQVSVHVYARGSGKKFKTKKHKNGLLVERLK